MGIWDKEKRTFTDPNELHNEKAMEGMLEGTDITSLYLNQDPQAAMKNKISNFDKSDLRKACVQAQVKDDETVNIASISI